LSDTKNETSLEHQEETMHPLKIALVTYCRVMGAESRRLSTKLQVIYAKALGMVTPRKFASQASAEPIPEVYTWAFPGGPVRIHLNLNVVERLSCEVKESFESIPSQGREIGGLLLGTTDLHAHRIEIKDFERFPCECRPDHHFVLPDSDRETFAARRSMGRGELNVVGYYRSHIAGDLSLREEDLSLARACFGDPANVFLLIKPSDCSLSAGFFFWDNDRIDPDFSYLEFPFDAQQLATAREISEDSPPEGEEQRLVRVLRWRWSPVVAVLVLALAALGYTAWQKRAPSLTPTFVAPQTAGLALEVERHENDLRLSWNRNTPVVNHAKEAMLSIRDGDLRQELHLGREQLQNRSVVYSPVNATVQFRLEITAPDNTKTSESVLMLTAAAANAPGATSIAATSHTGTRRKRAGFTGRKPLVQRSGKLPFTCSAGDVFRKTDAPHGWDTFVCHGKNVWSILVEK
jgi:hypothetical protein